MTPGEVRDELVTIQSRLRTLEDTVERQKSANVGYYNVSMEIVEGWDALERAIESCDETEHDIHDLYEGYLHT